MAKFCTIHPEVKVGDNFERSQSFGEIKSYVFNDYESSNNIYFAVKNKLRETGGKNLPLNSQNELSIDEILTRFDVRPFLPKDFTDKVLNSFGIQEENYSVENYQTLLNKCQKLNDSIYGKNYYATIEASSDKITPVIRYKTTKESYSKESKEQERSTILYNKVLDILNRWGIGVDTLHDAEARATNGVIDFSSIEKATDGLYHLIRIAKGDKGVKALPEEFGHVVVEAMKNSPLVQRTLNLIKNKGLAEEILGSNFEKYSQEYHEDEDLLAEEALGKLIAVHFLQQNGIEDNKIYSTILGRTINNVKQFFSKFNESELSDAINEINENTAFIASNIDKLEVDPVRLKTNKVLKQIDASQERINRLKKSLRKIIENEEKRMRIYKRSEATTNTTRSLLREMLSKIQTHDYAEAIMLYIENSNKQLMEVLQDIKELENFEPDLQIRAKYLRNFRNILYSYYNIMKELDTDLYAELKLDDSQLNPMIPTYIRENLGIIARSLSIYNHYATELVLNYWKPILGDTLVIDKGWFKKNPKTYTVEEILDMDINDISWFDCWLDSMGHSENYLLKGMDKVVKEKKTNARLRAVEFYKRIAALTRNLEANGIKNQSWMFERDKDGKRTGRYINALDSESYHKAMAQAGIDLNNPEEVAAWEKTHPISDYYTPEFKKLSKLQQDYYFEVMKMKKELDNLLPPKATTLLNTIKIRKDLLERIKSSHSIKEGFQSFMTDLKEGWVRNSTETDFGVKSTIQDFEGFEYKELPIFYVNKSNDTSEEDISMDIVSTMTAYAMMAYENSEMMSIIDVLETTRSLTRGKKPISTKGGKLEMELDSNNPHRKEDSNILKRMNSFFDMQIYKETKKDEGTIGESKIDKGKAADRLAGWSSKITMAFNLLANISNIATGRIQILEEAIGGQFYSFKDLKWADLQMNKYLLGFSQDLCSKTKSSWLWTVSQAFNVMQDYESLAHADFDKNWYERMSIDGLSMLGQHAGEFMLQHKTFFALMHSDKEALTDAKGNKVKAIDAFTVEPIDSNHPSRGSEIVFKSGLTDTKGRRIITRQELKERAKKNNVPWTDRSLLNENEISESQYINYMSRKSAGINNLLHGIYNEEDRAAMYSRSLGRLVGQYRKWIKPSINRRFASTSFNYDLDTMQEGFYRTLIRFTAETIRELHAKNFNIGARWKEMSDYEKANMRRALTEISTYLAILIAIALIPDDDDDWADSYAGRLATYQLYRLKTEIGVMIPGTSMVQEGLKILDSPMAGMRVLDMSTSIIRSLAPWQWTQIKSGRYKGWYRPFNTIADLVPYNRAIYRSMHPEQGVSYFK